MKHSPQIALRNAIAERNFAEQQCPHWDLEKEAPYDCHDCCFTLAEAEERVRRIKRAIKAPNP